MERLMEDVAYEAPDKSGSALVIDAAYVDRKLAKLAGDEDLSRYIL
jgi:ATP-dependent HslUV protease ATP-binding subunit HslU